MIFFSEHSQFFRPLVSKYRGQMVECICALYERLYGAEADYAQTVERPQVVETFQEALVRAPIMADAASEAFDSEDAEQGRFRDTREQAGWFLTQLLDAGWLDRQVDDATLEVALSFTRTGRRFAEAFVDDRRRAWSSHRSRHRNTRNVRNALQSFLTHGEVYDLLDAWDYSERILADFTDVIEELNERRRALVREMQGAYDVDRASAEFFEFMEQRFQPDIAIRLSADSVEKYREQISAVIRRIRRQPKAFKADAEQRLRELLPDQVQAGQSLLWQLLDGIDQRVKNAAIVMLPALRRSLQHFTKRADIIMRQMNYLSSRKHADVAAIAKRLAALPTDEQSARLAGAAEAMAGLQLALPDPGQLRLHERRRQVATDYHLDDDAQGDVAAMQAVYIDQAEAQAFYISQQKIHDYIQDRLADQESVTSAELSIESTEDFMAVAHIISAGQLDNW
ncbi:MAG: Wadjet anti-phage system protein JetA family protein, partial [Natronospirillum sp.]